MKPCGITQLVKCGSQGFVCDDCYESEEIATEEPKPEKGEASEKCTGCEGRGFLLCLHDGSDPEHAFSTRADPVECKFCMGVGYLPAPPPPPPRAAHSKSEYKRLKVQGVEVEAPKEEQKEPAATIEKGEP